MASKYIGVYETTLKDGSMSYRSSIVFCKKHIALGSFETAAKAHKAYEQASRIVKDPSWTLSKYRKGTTLPFEKCVVLVNFRDNHMYIPTPIYLQKNYFYYYLSQNNTLKFDIDDLFYYSMHKIMQRGSHLFVADYGSQISIPSRYGIKSYAVRGRDYDFVNGDPTDFRYENIVILNRYNGVRQISENGFIKYKAVIHVKSNYVVGKYNTENEAAIAYNKAADILMKKGIGKKYALNYIEDLSASQYAEIYTNIKLRKTIENMEV
ncbi:MAG: hypothetical protein K6A23_03995 [Butyrivibrio sp.]|nr:hypothetical protein [Butyrivibrio sp.]